MARYSGRPCPAPLMADHQGCAVPASAVSEVRPLGGARSPRVWCSQACNCALRLVDAHGGVLDDIRLEPARIRLSRPRSSIRCRSGPGVVIAAKASAGSDSASVAACSDGVCRARRRPGAAHVGYLRDSAGLRTRSGLRCALLRLACAFLSGEPFWGAYGARGSDLARVSAGHSSAYTIRGVSLVHS